MDEYDSPFKDILGNEIIVGNLYAYYHAQNGVNYPVYCIVIKKVHELKYNKKNNVYIIVCGLDAYHKDYSLDALNARKREVYVKRRLTLFNQLLPIKEDTNEITKFIKTIYT